MKKYRACASVLLCLCAFNFTNISIARASAVADDYTVLYYLVEMHRQRGQSCSNLPKQALPNLTPSEGLREVAQSIASTGRPLQEALAEHKLTENQVFATQALGADPKAALENLKQLNCASLENPQYKFIGAAKRDEHWVVLLSAINPPKSGKSLGLAVPMVPANPTASVSGGNMAVSPSVENKVKPKTSDSKLGVTPLQDERPVVVPPVVVAPPVENTVAGAVAASQPSQNMGALATGSALTPVAGSTSVAGKVAESGSRPNVGVEETLQNSSGTTVSASTPSLMAVPITSTNSSATVGNTQVTGRPLGLSSPDSPEGQMLTAVNRARVAGAICGGEALRAKELKENVVLSKVAAQRAMGLGLAGNQGTPKEQVKSAELLLAENNYIWTLFAENTGTGAQSPMLIVGAFLNNAGQCKSLLNDAYSEIGIGYAPSYSQWVVILAKPSTAMPK